MLSGRFALWPQSRKPLIAKRAVLPIAELETIVQKEQCVKAPDNPVPKQELSRSGGHMKLTLTNATFVVLLVGFGMAIEHARAAARSPLPEAPISHLGFVVKDIDKAVRQWGEDLQGAYPPIHSIGEPGGRVRLKWPEGYKTDPNSYVRTTEIQMKGFEIHLMQPLGSANVWKEHLDRYGDGSLEHIAFQTKDVDGMVEALTRMGGKVRLGGKGAGMAYIQMPSLPFMLEINPFPRQ